MSITNVVKILVETQANHILLLTHHNSDPDAICSAYAFQSLIRKMRPNVPVEIGAGSGISKLSKQILKHIPITVNLNPSTEEADALILLDTNTIQQLGTLAEKVKKTAAPIIVVDHHAPHPETEHIARLVITQEEAASTCEMVYNFYKEVDTKPDLSVAKALFLGIAFDTRHFLLANSSTFQTVAELGDIGVNAQEILPILSLPMDSSERVARIKACQRARLLKMGKWIIALSRVSAYQASAARALVDIGAHLAVVAGQKNGGIEISMRSTREFNKETKINLGRDIAKPLGESLLGMGGGHATAAGVNGIGNVETGLKLCLQLINHKIPIIHE
jgi:bifunctional oligoribonuclease and PAP phosphatase NrnA